MTSFHLAVSYESVARRSPDSSAQTDAERERLKGGGSRSVPAGAGGAGGGGRAFEMSAAEVATDGLGATVAESEKREIERTGAGAVDCVGRGTHS